MITGNRPCILKQQLHFTIHFYTMHCNKIFTFVYCIINKLQLKFLPSNVTIFNCYMCTHHGHKTVKFVRVVAKNRVTFVLSVVTKQFRWHSYCHKNSYFCYRAWYKQNNIVNWMVIKTVTFASCIVTLNSYIWTLFCKKNSLICTGIVTKTTICTWQKTVKFASCMVKNIFTVAPCIAKSNSYIWTLHAAWSQKRLYLHLTVTTVIFESWMGT